MTLVYERDGRETKFQRCISSQGTGEYRIDSKLVSYDTYASRLQDLGVLASAHTGFLVFQGYVSELANKSPSELTVGSHTSASRRTAASTSPERGTNHMHPVRRHCQALFEKISGSEELKAEDERLAKEKKAAEDDQQYNFNKKRALGQEVAELMEGDQQAEAENDQENVAAGVEEIHERFPLPMLSREPASPREAA